MNSFLLNIDFRRRNVFTPRSALDTRIFETSSWIGMALFLLVLAVLGSSFDLLIPRFSFCDLSGLLQPPDRLGDGLLDLLPRGKPGHLFGLGFADLDLPLPILDLLLLGVDHVPESDGGDVDEDGGDGKDGRKAEDEKVEVEAIVAPHLFL